MLVKYDFMVSAFWIFMLRRKLPMAWGTKIDIVTKKTNPFQYARETKHLTLKDLETYLIPDG